MKIVENAYIHTKGDQSVGIPSWNLTLSGLDLLFSAEGDREEVRGILADMAEELASEPADVWFDDEPNPFTGEIESKRGSEKEKTARVLPFTQTGWLARDEDGGLYLYEDKPKRDSFFWATVNPDCYMTELDPKLFPSLKWEDEPIEVELWVKPKKEERK